MIKLTQEEFERRGNEIHNFKYDYSLSKYEGSFSKVEIICPIHGKFEQFASKHIFGFGCQKCARFSKRTTNDEFIERSIKVHGKRFDYSKSNYVEAHTKVVIICSKHGEFLQTPHSHYKGMGFLKCKKSRGEVEIENILIENKISYDTQKKFEKCKNINPLFFDFYLRENNLCIEYDGEQHFEKYRFEKNYDKLKIRQHRDKIKTDFCLENDIKLIRIKYNEDIKEKLKCLML